MADPYGAAVAAVAAVAGIVCGVIGEHTIGDGRAAAVDRFLGGTLRPAILSQRSSSIDPAAGLRDGVDGRLLDRFGSARPPGVSIHGR